MPVIAVTRLRPQDPALLDDFFAAAVALLEQAKGSSGSLGTNALAEPNNMWWTCSGWDTRDSMRSFVITEPHLGTMPRLDDWCDEASFADWDSDSADIPSWAECHRRIVESGTSAELPHASPDNKSRTFPQPVENA